MKITVTQDDIDQGHRFDGCRCPVALALMTAGYRTVRVQEECISSDLCAVPTPQDVLAFIKAFDRSLPVQPFEFELSWFPPASPV